MGKQVAILITKEGPVFKTETDFPIGLPAVDSDETQPWLKEYPSGVAVFTTDGVYDGSPKPCPPMLAQAWFDQLKRPANPNRPEGTPAIIIGDYEWCNPPGVVYIIAPIDGEAVIIDVMTLAEYRAKQALGMRDAVKQDRSITFAGQEILNT